MAFSFANYTAALKAHYTDAMIEDLVFKDNPLLAKVAKYEKMGGLNTSIVCKYAHGGGRSADFSTAQTGATQAPGIVQFALTHINDYGVGQIDGDVLDMSKGDADAFMDALTVGIDGAIGKLTNTLARDIYRAGWGSIGKLSSSSSVTGAVLTLDDPADATNFNVGDVVVFSGSESGATLRDSGDSLTILSVQRLAGTVTFSTNMSNIAGLAVGDFVFIKGDRQDSATPTKRKIAGLLSWCPTTAPSAGESFFSVDRSVDDLLYGSVYTPSTGTAIEQALIDADARVARLGGRVTDVFINPAQYANLIKQLGSKVQYVEQKVTANVGFPGVQIQGQRGLITVTPDHNCPSTYAFCLSLPSWKLYSNGKAVRLWNEDGLMMTRQTSADGIEVRTVFRGNLGCSKPGHNIVVSLPSI